MPFGISSADRRQHTFIIGKTGTGKSTLLRNLICQEIMRGNGVGVIDPHGELSQEILDCIPSWRVDDVVYFDPGDSDFPVAFNLLRPLTKKRRHLEASAIVGAFKHQWKDSWGPRLEYILYAAVAALMECENVSLLGIPRMLTDEEYRWWVVRQVKDPMVRYFWEREFTSYDKRFLAEIIAPIQNKVGQLLMAAPLRNVFGQVKNKIDPRSIMDRKHIFIANLSKGRLGEDKTNRRSESSESSPLLAFLNSNIAERDCKYPTHKRLSARENMRISANNPPEGFCARSLSHFRGRKSWGFSEEGRGVFKSSDPFPRSGTRLKDIVF